MYAAARARHNADAATQCADVADEALQDADTARSVRTDALLPLLRPEDVTAFASLIGLQASVIQFIRSNEAGAQMPTSSASYTTHTCLQSRRLVLCRFGSRIHQGAWLSYQCELISWHAPAAQVPGEGTAPGGGH